MRVQTVVRSVSFALLVAAGIGGCAMETDMAEPVEDVIESDDVGAVVQAVDRGDVWGEQHGIGEDGRTFHNVYFGIKIGYRSQEEGVAIFIRKNDGPGQARVTAFMAVTCEDEAESRAAFSDVIIEPGEDNSDGMFCRRVVSAAMRARLDN